MNFSNEMDSDWEIVPTFSLFFIFITLWAFSITFLAIFTHHYKVVPFIFLSPFRDFWYSYRSIKILTQVSKRKEKNQSIIDLFHEVLKKYPNKVCFYFENSRITYREVENLSNKIASVLARKGFMKGHVVGLLMENRLEYPIIWLALAKIGVITSLISTDLRRDNLNKAIKIVRCKGLIVSQYYFDALNEIKGQIVNKLDIYTFKDKHRQQHHVELQMPYNDLRGLISYNISTYKVQKIALNFSDPVLYIYTSGTTGLPKPTRMTNANIIIFAYSYMNLLEMNVDTDIIYSPFPLHHLASGILGVAPAFFRGVTVVIRKQFQPLKLMKECIKFNVTVVQFIGETSRYLLNTPVSENDRKHKIRKFLGKGTRPHIWKKLTDRFGVKDINEFYVASEGNGNMCNYVGRIGAVGFVPNIIPDSKSLFALVKYDWITGHPTPKVNGFCERVLRNEPGLLLTEIKNTYFHEFKGFVDGDETEKNVVVNVFKKGDYYYNTGDILVQDKFGYFYFKDRIRDTFKWKGKNVFTTEVENVISMVVKSDVCVYGVQVDSTKGLAGMVAICIKDLDYVDMEAIANVVKENLPKHARPLFVRHIEEMNLTTTFKIKKNQYREDGFNIHYIRDPIYFLKDEKYVKLTPALYKEIVNRKLDL